MGCGLSKNAQESQPAPGSVKFSDGTPAEPTGTAAVEADAAIEAGAVGVEKCNVATLAEKVERIKKELGLDPSLSLVQAVRAAQEMLGIEPDGPLTTAC